MIMSRRLVSLDIFAGCGGLSQGLHDAGVAETRWAVEIYAPAANAFQLNNKELVYIQKKRARLIVQNILKYLLGILKKLKFLFLLT